MNSVGLFKRLLIIVYDGLLLIGVLFASSLAFLLLPDTFEATPIGVFLKQLYLVGISFLFYGWFWTHGGQTLGMRSWDLYLVNPEGKFISWPTAAIRFFSAILSWAAVGLGFTWILLDKQKRAWHDLLSTSRIVHVPKSSKVNQA